MGRRVNLKNILERNCLNCIHSVATPLLAILKIKMASSICVGQCPSVYLVLMQDGQRQRYLAGYLSLQTRCSRGQAWPSSDLVSTRSSTGMKRCIDNSSPKQTKGQKNAFKRQDLYGKKNLFIHRIKNFHMCFNREMPFEEIIKGYSLFPLK